MVKQVKYRNGDYPGEFSVRAKDGREITVAFWRMAAYFQEFKPRRCQICSDWISCFADVSVADGSRDPLRLSLNKSHASGQSLVFVRSRRGADAMRFACNVGYLRCENTRFETNAGLELKIRRLSALVFSKNRQMGRYDSCINAFCRQWSI